mmetsp:Transcript_7250/g.9395  ORF Transcript_7250/g.9395 Transcript_7250/m.9395 type:complete len:240 (-) Transcript_7250:139-858(-)
MNTIKPSSISTQLHTFQQNTKIQYIHIDIEISRKHSKLQCYKTKNMIPKNILSLIHLLLLLRTLHHRMATVEGFGFRNTCHPISEARIISSNNYRQRNNCNYSHRRSYRSRRNLCPEQASQLVAASWSDGAYVRDKRPVQKSSDELLALDTDARNKRDWLSKILHASPQLLPHIWGNPNSSNQKNSDDGYLVPIVGFRWVENEDEMFVLPPSSIGTMCRLPRRDEDVYGWFNEVCRVDV